MKKIFFVFIAALAGLLFSARIQAQVIEDPGNLVSYRGKNGTVLEVRVTGVTDGSVWGGENGIYTDDSRLAKAAVHAGLVKPGEKVVVTVVIMAGRSSYPSINRNGITTTGYGPWHGSYGFRVPGTQTTPPEAVPADAINDPGNMVAYRGRNGQTFNIRVRGTNDGSVWGGSDGVYTDDSRIGKAAVHAGLLRPGQEGVVRVIVVAGKSGYGASTQNGITTTGYGNWHGSFRFADAAAGVSPVPPATPVTPPASQPVVTDAINDPGNMVGYRGRNGQTFNIRVRGTTDGSVWGGSDGVYTDDSHIGKAAVHAGLLRPGQEGVVRVIVVAGKSGYGASTKNGITTTGYGNWHGSFRFADATADVSPVPPATPVTPPASQPVVTDAINDPGNMVAYRGRNGQTFNIRVRGTKDGSLWGGSDGIYTDDSRIGKAAVHAGLLKPGEERVLRVKILPGRSSYPASTKNGITSTGYGSWHGSYAFE